MCVKSLQNAARFFVSMLWRDNLVLCCSFPGADDREPLEMSFGTFLWVRSAGHQKDYSMKLPHSAGFPLHSLNCQSFFHILASFPGRLPPKQQHRDYAKWQWNELQLITITYELTVKYITRITLSLLRVNMSNFPCSLSRNIRQHSMKNWSFHSLPRWKMITIPILATSLVHFLFRCWEKVLFELRSERVKRVLQLSNRSCQKSIILMRQLESIAMLQLTVPSKLWTNFW